MCVQGGQKSYEHFNHSMLLYVAPSSGNGKIDIIFVFFIPNNKSKPNLTLICPVDSEICQ